MLRTVFWTASVAVDYVWTCFKAMLNYGVLSVSLLLCIWV